MNLVQSLQHMAETKGNHTAYLFQGTPTSYADLAAAAKRVASGLSQLGVKQGDHVALIVGNSPEFVMSLYGIMRLGATVVPVNPIYTIREVKYMLQQAEVTTVLALDILAPMLDKLLVEIPAIERVILLPTLTGELPSNVKMKPFSDLLALGDAPALMPKLANDDIAVILYTSGTTGKPKGAMLTHENLYCNACDTAAYLRYTENDRVIAALPMFHVFCLTVVLHAPLVSGATILILPSFSPREVFRVAREQGATVFAGVPTMYSFLYHYADGDGKREDLQTLRLCVSGGAALPVALLHSFEEKFSVIVSEGYGLSEASPVTCFNPLDRPRKPGSIGTSISNVQNKVVNEMGQELLPGEVGELIVHGRNVMKGYYKMPEDTAAAIRDDWLYTGDLAYRDEDGYFYIVDRKKDMVNVAGYNVYPREVEEVLYAHEAVVEAAVIGVPDETYGEVVKAFVVCRDASITEDELRTYCSMYLVKYKVPAEIEFLAELPKNTTGKILRRVLRMVV